MSIESIYWYDLETYGLHPAFDRIAQFAGLRTDLELNSIETPEIFYCQLTPDYLPDPNACLVSGLSPDVVNQNGMIEPEFIRRIHHHISQPGSCVSGFNNLRFDDEFIRFTLFRNFYDPYAREWQQGNSRFDLIDGLRMARALRPDGVVWPTNEQGLPSLKLEDLTRANGIEHSQAHDALADVYATIAMAKLLKKAQPKLYDYYFKLRKKRNVIKQLEPIGQIPIVHISGQISLDTLNCAVMLPIAHHPTNKNGVICCDLSDNINDLLHLSVQDIRLRLFSKQSDLADTPRFKLKVVHINKCPALAPIKTLSSKRAADLGIDLDTCWYHLDMIRQQPGFANKIQAVYQDLNQLTDVDAEQALYSGGFINERDAQTAQRVRQCAIEKLPDLAVHFDDQRLKECFFRYQSRYQLKPLTDQQQTQWNQYIHNKLLVGPHPLKPNMPYWHYFNQQIQSLKDGSVGPNQLQLLDQLMDYGQRTVKPFIHGLEPGGN